MTENENLNINVHLGLFRLVNINETIIYEHNIYILMQAKIVRH